MPRFEVHNRKEVFEGIDQYILGFMVLIMSTVIYSMMFYFVSFSNEIIHVHRYSHSLCWVHLFSCTLHFKTCPVRFFFYYSKQNISHGVSDQNQETCISKGFSLTSQNFGQKRIESYEYLYA